MTAPRKVALTNHKIREASWDARDGVPPDSTYTDGFKDGAHFARDFYEQREALWREYVGLQPSVDDTTGILRLHELRAALGLEV